MHEALVVPLPTVTLRLLLAFALGGIIGLEREWHDRPAGLRTHILVTVAAALLMMISQLVAGDQFDPGRIAAGVVTGIGFLGAGTIIRYGADVRGLTTAAGIWAASAVGLAVGLGWYGAALVAAALIFITLAVLRRLEWYLAGVGGQQRVTIRLIAGSDFPADLLAELRQVGLRIDGMDFGGDGEQTILDCSSPGQIDEEAVVQLAGNYEAVASVRIL